ncbi:MAG TPA: ABC transporter permease [Thermomicrobiales bacterium]|nr:ABC transporter permease [Thermomicrobiales bacterium]
MTASAASPRLAEQARVAEEPHRGQWQMFWRRFRRHLLAVVSAVILAFIFIVAALAPIVAPYDPNKTDSQLARFGEPAPPSLAHPFGSDQLGRDQLSRIIYGARVSLVVGFLATGVAIIVGTVSGAVAGYAGRSVDMLVMRVADVLLAFPPLLFLMAALASVDKTIVSIALVIAIISWMNVARLVRGEFLVLRQREYTEAARAIGASAPSIIFRELLPNALGPIIVAASLGIPGTILTESTLSFLGFGLQPPTASWGNMLQNSFSMMRDFGAWWMIVFPGFMIALTVLSFNFLGDGLRDALDPRTRPD